MLGFKNKDRYLRLTWRFIQKGKIRHLSNLGSSQTIWIETGTYVGNTTRILAKNSCYVFSIEPMLKFHNVALRKLKNRRNVNLILGTSQDFLSSALVKAQELAIASTSEKCAINIFLDGHYSGPGTFLSSESTPIIQELSDISNFVQSNSNHKIDLIVVDDARLFINEQPGYPSIEMLSKSFPIFEFSLVEDFDFILVKPI